VFRVVVVAGMPPIAPECEPLADEVDGLISTERSLQAELRTAPPAFKPFPVRTIRALDAEIAEGRAELRECIEERPVDVPEPLTATVDGTGRSGSTTRTTGPGDHTPSGSRRGATTRRCASGSTATGRR
jgi:hypothetical protein